MEEDGKEQQEMKNQKKSLETDKLPIDFFKCLSE